MDPMITCPTCLPFYDIILMDPMITYPTCLPFYDIMCVLYVALHVLCHQHLYK
jgi:hypothetical protein